MTGAAARLKPSALANGAPAQRAAEPVRLGALDGYIGFYLRLAQTASFQAFAREVGDSDLRPGRFAILYLIGENPGISQTALSRINARDKSTLTPVLDDLAARGLIVRDRPARDRRSYALRLTPAGQQTLDRLRASAERHDARIDRIVGAAEKPRFLALLRRLAVELSDDAPDAS